MRVAKARMVLAAAGVCALAANANAQDSSRATKKSKSVVTFFDDTKPLDVTIQVNLEQLQGDRGDSTPWRQATLTYKGMGDTVRAVPVLLRTRGIWRRKKCEYPPIRLNFSRSTVQGTLFEGLDKPKLVSFCRDAGVHEQYVLQEFQLYRVYSRLTPNGHRARLIRLTYLDSATNKLAAKRYAFIVEEPKAMAHRMGGKVIEDKGALADDMDDYSLAVFGLFEYMAGNTDFSITQLHNAELVALPTGGLVPVAYDFDFSGAVNTSYAVPEPRLRLDNVRTRRYRGYCVPREQFQAAVDLFNSKKKEILALYADDIGKMINSRQRDSLVDYFEEFYSIINDSRSLKSQVIESCLVRDKTDAPNR